MGGGGIQLELVIELCNGLPVKNYNIHIYVYIIREKYVVCAKFKSESEENIDQLKKRKKETTIIHSVKKFGKCVKIIIDD